MEQEFYDLEIRKMLIEISKKELEKCIKEEKVPSKEVLDTVNTLVNFQNAFFR